MRSFVKGMLGATLVLSLLAPVLIQAAGLTSSQISSVIGLLQAFGVDAKTITAVRIGLTRTANTATVPVHRSATTTTLSKKPVYDAATLNIRTSSTTTALKKPVPVQSSPVYTSSSSTTTITTIQPAQSSPVYPRTSTSPAPAWKKTVYDATQYKEKPDLQAYGLQPINVIYEWRFFALNDDMNVPLSSTLSSIGREATGKGMLTVVDIERWKMWDSVGITENVPKYVATLQELKRAAPGLKIGYYGAAPQNNYSAAQKSTITPAYVQWQQLNDSLKLIADTADATFPSLYTYSTDQQGWVNYATALIKEARRYNKPVYVFIWPQYADTASDPALRLQYLPAQFWKLQLETAAKLADGIVIWTPSGLGATDAATWNNTAPWWLVTKEFLAVPTAFFGPATATGTITARNGSSITIQTSQNTALLVTVTASTPIEVFPETLTTPTVGSIDDLTVGKGIAVKGTYTAGGGLTALGIKVGRIPAQ